MKTLRIGTAGEAGMCPGRLEHLGNALRGWMARSCQTAVVAVVARRGVVVLQEALGSLQPEPGSAPVQPDTVSAVASIAKPVTATAAMILVEEGRLGLNIPVSFYVPEFSGEGKDAITVLHLLTHASGLRDQELNEHAKKAEETAVLPEPESTQHPQIAKYFALRSSAPLWKLPGQEMSYCNYGYNLLGEVVRRVSGSSFVDFTRKRILEPIGMMGTSWCLADSRAHKAALPVEPVVRQWAEDWRRIPWPSASLFTTGHDLAVFGQLFLNGGAYGPARILSPATAAAMTRNQIPGVGAHWGDEFFQEACWGLGWGVWEGRKGTPWGGALATRRAFGHVGAGGNLLFVDPGHEIVIVYLAAQETTRAMPRYPFEPFTLAGALWFIDAAMAAITD